MSVVLVTGGSGLVGRAIQYVIENEPVGSKFGRREGETWIFAKSSEADLRNPAATEQLFDEKKPTHVIHLAALVGGLFENMKHKLTFLRDNMLINVNVLEACHDPTRDDKPGEKRRPKVQKLISCLSTCVFPDKIEYPITEDMVHLGPPHESNFGYAHAKRMVDVYNHAYKEEFHCNFTSAIPTNVFGPHDNFDLQASHVIPGLIHKCYNAQKEDVDLVVVGTGTPRRQFIYSRDLAKLFIWMLREYDDVEPLILSVSEKEEVSIAQVATAIACAMGHTTGKYDAEGKPIPRITFTPGADGQFKKTASNEKLRSLIGDEFKFTGFEEALDQTVKWFKDNYDNDGTQKDKPPIRK